MAAPITEAIQELEQGGVNQTVKDLFSGAVGGIAQVLIGMHEPSLNPPFPSSSLLLLSLCYELDEENKNDCFGKFAVDFV